MDALCAMFEQIDRAVVEIVLEASGGDADRALDQLLKMAAEQSEEGAASDSDAAQAKSNAQESAAGQIDIIQDYTEQDLETFLSGGGSDLGDVDAKDPPSAPKEIKEVGSKQNSWRKPLPEDFLRLPVGITVARAREEQIRQDELFAKMLANEGFRNELAQHAEFRAQTTSSGSSSSNDLHHAWNELSEAAKTKFSALATKFRRAAAETSAAASTSATPHAYSAVQFEDEDDEDDETTGYDTRARRVNDQRRKNM